MDELVDDGDEIVCLRVVEKDSKIASDVEEGKYRQEAEKLFKQVIQKNSQDEKAISLVLELAIGKVQEIIQRMVSIRIHCSCASMSDTNRSTSMNQQFSLSAPAVEV